MADIIQVRRDVSSRWANVNPILAEGEIGIELDQVPFKAKIGNGISSWNQLGYWFSNVDPIVSVNANTIHASKLVFTNANNISFTLNGSSLEASASFSQSLQTQNSVNVQGSTGGIVFSNANNVSFSFNNSTIQASASFSQSTSPAAIAASNGSISSGTIILSNANNIVFGVTNNSITASAIVPTDYVSSNQSSLFQQTSQMTDYLGTNYTTHTHSQYLNTSQSSLFQQTSGTTVFLTSQSNQAVSAGNGSSAFQTLSLADSNGISFSTGTQGLYGSVRTDYMSSNQSSNFMQTSERNNYFFSSNNTFANSTHTHGNVAGTNISVTSASNGLSLSVAAGAAQTQQPMYFSASGSSSSASTLQFGNSNGVSFSISNGSIVGSVATNYQSQGAYLTTAAQSNQVVNSLNGSTGQISLNIGSSLSSSQNGSSITFGLASNITTALQSAGAYLTTAMQSNAGSNFVNTSQSSLFQQTSLMSNYQTTGNYLTSQSNQAFSASGSSSTFQTLQFGNTNGVSFSISNGSIVATVATNYQSQGAYLTTAMLSNANTGFLSTSQSSLFQQTSLMSNYQTTGNYLTTARASNDAIGLNTAQSNVTWSVNSGGISLDNRGYAGTNTTFNGANISGSLTLNSNGLNLSLSANPGGGGADGYNILAAGTQTANTTGTVVLSNSNGLSFGMNNSSVITGSYTVPSVTQFQLSANMTDYLGTGYTTHTHSQYLNTSQSSLFRQTSADSQLFFVSQSSNLQATSLMSNYLDTNYTTHTHNQSNQQLSVFAVGNTTVNSSNTIPSQSIIINGLGMISVGISNSSIGISATQSNPNISLYALGNTTQNSSTVLNVSNLSFNGLGNITVGFSNGSIQISQTGGGGGGITNINLSAGTTSNNLSNFVFSNSNNISFGLNGSTITASADVAGVAPRSFYNPYEDLVMVAGAVGQGTLNINPNVMPAMTFNRVLMPINNTNSSNSSGSHTLSFWLGIYTANASTLSLLTSASQTYALTHSGTAGSYSLYSGIRHVSLALNTSLSEGRYFIGVISRTTSAGTNGSYSQLLVSNLNSNFLGHFGSSHNTTIQFQPGIGVYSATTSAMPNSIAFSQIRGSDSAAQRPPVIIFANSTY